MSSSFPDTLLCPITRVPFVDPVIADDGRTYERSAIEHWFSMGHHTSPLTAVAISTRLIPNRSLKDEVERLLEFYKNRHFCSIEEKPSNP